MTEFVKMHGLRNHFVIVDARETHYLPSRDEVIWICDPKTGVGADGLLILESSELPGVAAFMRIFNIDGTEVQACGNATRCVAWMLLEEACADEIVMETAASPLKCMRYGDQQVKVEMGRLTRDWESLPLSGPCDMLALPVGNGPLQNPVALAIGNPHAVFFVDDLDVIDLTTLAPGVMSDPVFPDSVNVGVVQMLSDSAMRLSVYERPGVLTTACGSGACAAVQAARLTGRTGLKEMTVHMPAGTVTIRIRPGDVAEMIGPVAHCFVGQYKFHN